MKIQRGITIIIAVEDIEFKRPVTIKGTSNSEELDATKQPL